MPTTLLKPRGKWLRRALWLAATLPPLWLASSFFVAYRLTHRAHPYFAEPAPAVPWAQFTSFHLTTTDNQSIGAWFASAGPNAPVALILHGNGGSRGSCLAQSHFFLDQGYSTLLISLRTHGDSTGERKIGRAHV